jgi:predicted NodU family carbamoyl transferase
MTTILGISAFYHDSAAALVVDGEIVAAAQEERFTRKKHDHGFPSHAVDYCLEEAGLGPEQLDYVGFYDKPVLKIDRAQPSTTRCSTGLLPIARSRLYWISKGPISSTSTRAFGESYRRPRLIEHF